MDKNKLYFFLAFILVIVVGVVIWRSVLPSAAPRSASLPSADQMNSKKSPVKTASFQNITSSQLAEMLKQKDFTLVDVHIPEQPHIPGTDKFIPFNQILDRLSELPQDKNAKIVLYCRSGSMSRQAAQDLVQAGYTNVYNLEGGTIDWVRSGNPVEEIKL